MREIVVHRMVRGSIRSKETMRWGTNIFMCVMFWKARNMDIHAELAKYVWMPRLPLATACPYSC